MKTSILTRIIDPIKNIFDFNQVFPIFLLLIKQYIKAHLSGCMDVIVIMQKNGDFACSPFHVRFGTFKILKVKDIAINLEINDKPVPFSMNLAEDGHGYFLKEAIDDFNKMVFK